MNNFLQHALVSRLKSCRQFRVVRLNVLPLVRVGIPDLAHHCGLLSTLLADLVLVQRIEHLTEVRLRRRLSLLLDLAEKVVQHRLVTGVARAGWLLNDSCLFCQHNHVVVANTALNQLFGHDIEFLVLEEQSLLGDRELRLDLEQALQVFDGDVALNFHAVEDVIPGQVLDEESHGALYWIVLL